MVDVSLTSTVARWRVALGEQRTRTPAHALYGGRSFSEAKIAAVSAEARLYVVSGGLGLVSANEEVPAYDLTAVGSDSGLTAALAFHGAKVSDWWDALCGGRGLAELIRVNAESVFMLALPCAYVRMVSADLERLARPNFERLRVFTSTPGRMELPSPAKGSVMPYDERLESLPAYAGTRADFPQRALRHFVERLHGHRMSRDAARHAVENALSSCTLRKIAQGARIGDEEARQLIRTQWAACDGRCSRLLRFFRDEARVACEQGRFRRLWKEVRDEPKGQGFFPGRDEHAVSA